jgi:Domain of unknown function (DUF4279)
MSTEISISLSLAEFKCDPDEISTLLGIVPTETWRVDELINPRGTLRYQYNGWALKSQLDTSAGLEEHMESLLKQLEPQWEIFTELGNCYDIEFSCVIYMEFGDQVPAIHFNKDILQKVANLNAEIDVDLYVLPAE